MIALDWLAPLYPWVKAVHVMAVISWMAGLFYLPRLFVYHVDAVPGSVQSETFKIMEGKLLRIIMRPAMHVSWGLGLVLLATPGVVDWAAGWVHVKLLAVVAMTAVHWYLARRVAVFAADANDRPGRFYRALNEAPTLLMIVIVLMVVAKPF
jgi:putative membrane protein